MIGLVRKVEGAPQRLTLTTDTPGFNAEIRAGNSPDGPFDAVVAHDARTAATTTWELGDTDAPYLVIWITDLEGRAHVNEVEASYYLRFERRSWRVRASSIRRSSSSR